MILSAGALLLTIRDFTQAIRVGGASGAYNSSQVVFDGVLALTTPVDSRPPCCAGICTGAPRG